ncbi:heme lyase CcmF/NrfE family subunit [Thiorhodovibrio frisius]|uniref:C-type cytochrome biogenesis protein CcmF n=1 Tax=Thiorhodovibrio frisius TaxID=631362 RepID=H8Z7Q4_9GAMM|nr:heme lyase CcmF/NrfE family subunit [Thiorhodovibrio frisius]EIC19907.1 c-type cytochrome biogenesis protein CcmF [Thiorhodovibrio frisius]WPL20635.1 Cytochrome c-type biogenesis protein CcmF [Thiorhodovibrio frisius]
MIPELGHFALIIALCFALAQAIIPLVGSFNGNRPWMALARPLAYGQLTFIAISFACLVQAFVVSDFSVTYVATNSNSLLPTIYKVSAVWGAHEGSLLLWVLMMAGWGAAVAIYSKNLPLAMIARVISVQGMVTIGFLLFTLLTSNPFDRLFPVPPEGRDLNPLLQDFGLAIHPPMLYMGYVGFSVAFAFAIAALIGGKLDAAWARWSRPWTTVAWIFLTIGIALGSWWAYYELGWGGWWFWDPVENASLMPWLIGTALMHSLAVTEKRAAFKSWTVLLAISAFSLSLLGTFLVRSGVLTSVHAFATDPTRGAFILLFLCVVIGGSLALYAWRAPSVSSGGHFDLLSRESSLLMNNLLFSAFTILVLFGTLAPLIYEAFGWGKISVGFPWFNKMFVALAPFLALLLGIGPLVRWKHDAALRLLSKLWPALVLTIGVGFWVAKAEFAASHLWVTIGISLAAWILFSHLMALFERLKNRPDGFVAGIKSIGTDLRGSGRGFYGMLIAHLGVAVLIIGITMVSTFDMEHDVRMSPGDSHELAGYRFEFLGAEPKDGPNYNADRGHFMVYRGDKTIAELFPEKRAYMGGGMPMTEAAIDAGLMRDIYVSLGEHVGGGDWALRLYYKPYVRWIWLGAIFMAIGGLLAVTDPRYRAARVKAQAPDFDKATAKA